LSIRRLNLFSLKVNDYILTSIRKEIEAETFAGLLGHSTTPGETRNTKVTRGYAHGVPKRLRDAVNSLEEGKLAIPESAPTSRQVASRA